MDIQKYELTDEPVFLQFEDPDTGRKLFDTKEVDGKKVDDPDKPIGVDIVGADSENYKKHMRRVTNRSLENQQKRRNRSITAEELDEEGQATLASCIHKFYNMEWRGKPLTVPDDSLPFVKAMPHFVEQIDKAMHDRRLFMPALSKG
jgi:hypothetical protein